MYLFEANVTILAKFKGSARHKILNLLEVWRFISYYYIPNFTIKNTINHGFSTPFPSL